MINPEAVVFRTMLDRARTDSFDGLMKRAIEVWNPIEDMAPGVPFDLAQGGFTQTDIVDLSSLTEGDLLYFTGENPWAYYTIKINPDNTLNLWRDRLGMTTGLTGRREDIITFDYKIGAEDNLRCFPGFLYTQNFQHLFAGFLLPYFRYANERALPPNNTWTDVVQSLWLKRHSIATVPLANGN